MEHLQNLTPRRFALSIFKDAFQSALLCSSYSRHAFSVRKLSESVELLHPRPVVNVLHSNHTIYESCAVRQHPRSTVCTHVITLASTTPKTRRDNGNKSSNTHSWTRLLFMLPCNSLDICLTAKHRENSTHQRHRRGGSRGRPLLCSTRNSLGGSCVETAAVAAGRARQRLEQEGVTTAKETTAPSEGVWVWAGEVGVKERGTVAMALETSLRRRARATAGAISRLSPSATCTR